MSYCHLIDLLKYLFQHDEDNFWLWIVCKSKPIRQSYNIILRSVVFSSSVFQISDNNNHVICILQLRQPVAYQLNKFIIA